MSKLSAPPTQPTVGVGVVIIKGCEVLMIKRGHPPRQGECPVRVHGEFT